MSPLTPRALSVISEGVESVKDCSNRTEPTGQRRSAVSERTLTNLVSKSIKSLEERLRALSNGPSHRANAVN
jgi:hypothetical protein